MTALKNVSNQQIRVTGAEGERDIAPGQTVEVEGRTNWTNHLFVKAGWLEVVDTAKPKRKTKDEQSGQDKQADTEQPEQG